MSEHHETALLATAGIGEAVLTRLLGTASSHLYVWDVESDVLRLSHPWPAIFGASPAGEPILGRTLEGRIAPGDAPTRMLAMAALLERDEACDCHYKLRRADGEMEWVEEHAIVAPSSPDGGRRVLGTLRVVSEAKAREERLRRAATYDRLTGLYNRERLAELMDGDLADCRREGRRCGFLLVNVDNLGILNEAHGFAVVDELIRGVARCVERQLEGNALLGRVGGNQFAILLPESDSSRLAGTAETIRSAVRAEVFRATVGVLSVTVSIGGVMAPDHAGDVTSMFGHGEEALGRAKFGGRDCYVEYHHSAPQSADRLSSLRLGERVLAALKGHRLRLALQPVVRASDREVAFHEALLRMEVDGGEVLPASAFMHVVEQLGLERLVDRHALDLVIEALEAAPDLRLAMNISGGTAADGTAFAQLLSALRANAAVADRLIIEITETVAMRDTHEIAWFIDGFRELGTRVALDDFGAGYSSFRHLKNLAVDLVKIDGQFVRGAASVPENQLFIKALADLARGLGVATVAECVENAADAAMLARQCVENAADAAMLARHDIDFMQGYHFGPPVLAALVDAQPAVTVAS